MFATMAPFGAITTPVSAVVLSQNNSAIESSLITTEEEKIHNDRAKAIDDFFAKRNAPLEGYGDKFVTEAEKNGVDYRLLAAIATIESNAGKQACKGAKNSVLGYGSCRIDFDSIDESIEIVTRNISGNNKNSPNRYYHSEMTSAQILKKYNSVIPTYKEKVFRVMKMIGPEEII